MGLERPLISVIVPVYNVEGYLGGCVDSLLAQTYPNIEVILVDDAATDGSGSLCDAYAAQDSRVRAIHFPENRGPSAARNEGLRQGRGEMVSFVDADDRVEPELLEKLYESLTGAGADISACGASGIALKPGPAAVYSQGDAIQCLAQGAPFNHVTWGKLYRTGLLWPDPFDEAVFYSEDLLFLYAALKRAGRVSYRPDILYHYTQREGSQVQSGITQRKCTAIPAQDSVCQDAAASFPEALDGFRQLALESDRNLAVLAVKNGCEGGRPFRYLKRLQANIRRHFSWKALALCPSKKNAASILLLYTSAAAFWGVARARAGVQGWKGGAR